MAAKPTALDTCVSETTTTGTGTLTVSNAPAPAYISVPDAVSAGLATDGETVDYRINIGSLGSPTSWEIGSGVLGSSGTTLTRNPKLTYNGSVYDASSPSALSLPAGTKYVAIVPNAATLNALVRTEDHGEVTSGTETPEPSLGQFQYIENGGAFTLAAPTEEGFFILTITNNASAGAVTLSGFDDELGDSFDTTDTNVFECLVMNTGVRTSIQVTAATDNT